MRVGLIASVAGHAALLGWGLLAFPDAENFAAPPVESMPVDLVSIEELTRLQKGEKDAELREIASVSPTETPVEETAQPAEKPGEAVQEPTPSATEAASAPEPEPVPEPEPAPPPVEAKPEPAPAPEPAAEPAEPEPIVANVVPRTKPKPPNRPKNADKPKDRDFDSNQIAALLNKVDPGGRSNSQSQDPASLGARRGEESVRMTQSELDALRSQIAQCWSPPAGAIGAEDLRVRVRFELARSGEVSGSPEVLNSSSNPAFRAAASSAVRAVMRCGPYNLPVAKYESWQQVIINFDPRELLGG